MEFIVKDPSINCVMSEDGKHWLLTTYDKPEPARTCKNVAVQEVMFECSECGAITLDAIGNYTQDYCPACGAKVVADEDTKLHAR